jgi:hypothetical protein
MFMAFYVYVHDMFTESSWHFSLHIFRKQNMKPISARTDRLTAVGARWCAHLQYVMFTKEILKLLQP